MEINCRLASARTAAGEPAIEVKVSGRAAVLMTGSAAAGEYNGFHKSLPPWIFHAH